MGICSTALERGLLLDQRTWLPRIAAFLCAMIENTLTAKFALELNNAFLDTLTRIHVNFTDQEEFEIMMETVRALMLNLQTAYVESYYPDLR